MDQNDKLLMSGESYGEIGYEWAFRILKEKYKERPGESIKRLTAQLGDMNQVIYQALGEGARDPDGAWGWLSEKRDDLHSLGNSEHYNDNF